MVDAHIIIFAALLAVAFVITILSTLGAVRESDANPKSVMVAVTGASVACCCIAGLYGAVYHNSFVQEVAVMLGGLIFFAGFVTTAIFF